MTAKECIDQLMSGNPFMRGCRDIDKCNDYINSLSELLEKQIPKEPSKLLKHMDYFHWECPTCHMSYGMATQKVKYCYTCGQAIKWE